MKTLADLLNKYDEITKEAEKERALWYLLKANEKFIERIFDEDKSLQNFHKAFRQRDITADGYTDMAIWVLLDEATLFWNLLESIQMDSTDSLNVE